VNRKLVIRIAVVSVAIIFILIGILNGEASIVLRKAREICLSCIGIG